jgi:hypothetical protein
MNLETMDLKTMDLGLDEVNLETVNKNIPDKLDEKEYYEDKEDYEGEFKISDIPISNSDEDDTIIDVRKDKILSADNMNQNTVSTQNIDSNKLDNFLKHVSFLQEEDKELININSIISKLDKYYNYFNNESFKEKQQKNKMMILKYSNHKNYSQRINKNNIDIYKINNKTKEESKLLSIEIPNMVRLDEVIPNLEDTIFNMRNLLNSQYTYLLTNTNIPEKEYNKFKNAFIKERDGFMKVLNLFYFLQSYYNMINKIDLTKNEIFLATMYEAEIGNHESINLVKRIRNKKIMLSNNDKQVIYDIESNKLNLYNKIIQNLNNPNKKELKKMMEQYINYNNQEIIKKVDKKINKLQNRQRIRTLYLMEGENINNLFNTGDNTNNVINRFMNIKYDDETKDEKRKADTKRYFILKNKGLI